MVIVCFRWVTMGFGTRLSKDVTQERYTPIAQMSLSGWIFLLALIVGGILEIHSKKIFEKASE